MLSAILFLIICIIIFFSVVQVTNMNTIKNRQEKLAGELGEVKLFDER